MQKLLIIVLVSVLPSFSFASGMLRLAAEDEYVLAKDDDSFYFPEIDIFMSEEVIDENHDEESPDIESIISNTLVTDTAPDLSFQEKLSAITEFLGGQFRSPKDYPYTLEGFKDFLQDGGVDEGSSQALITPHNSRVVSSCLKSDSDYQNHLRNPENPKQVLHIPLDQDNWNLGVIFALLSKRLEQVVDQEIPGAKVQIQNWYRPSCYHKRAIGKYISDHMSARSVDLTFTGTNYSNILKAREVAQRFLCETFYENNPISPVDQDKKSFPISMGLGPSLLHIGLFALPRYAHTDALTWERRSWSYRGYKHKDNAGPCWIKPKLNKSPKTKSRSKRRRR